MQARGRWTGLLPMAMVVAAAVSGGACGSSADAGADVPADVPGDVPADVPADVPGDVPADLPPDAPADVPPFVGPLDDVLRLNHLQVKGTHNSYHVASEGALPQWQYTHAPLDVQLDRQGVRQIELDVHWDVDLQRFLVFHMPLADPGTTCGTLEECLTVVKTWSDAHLGHAPIFILVEPKDDLDEDKITGHYDALDAEILSVWPRDRLIVPDDVRGAHATLTEALGQDGWPTLGQARSKAFFLLLDSAEHRDGYLADHPNLEGRVLFARGNGTEPWCGVIEHGNAVRDAAAIQADLLAGIHLVRTTADAPDAPDAENREKADQAMALGAHLISSDVPAPRDGFAYWFDLAGGTPVRCNPISAPEGCTSEAIENLGTAP